MSGEDIQSLLYEICSVLIVFIFFYVVLSTMSIFRLSELNSSPSRHPMAISFYLLLLFLCLFRFSTLIYMIFFTLQIPDPSHVGSYEINIFCILFPDFLFWSGFSCFFWLVIFFFYSSHITTEDLIHLNTGLQTFKVRLRSKFFLGIFMLLYAIIQIAIVGNYFTKNISFRVYASIQAGCSFIIPILVAYFIHRMYQIFSGMFYVSEENKKLAQMGVKTMIIILIIRFITGLIDLALLQTKLRDLLMIKEHSFDYYQCLLGLALVAVSGFFLEIVPIYLGLHLRVIKLCFKITRDGLSEDSPRLKKEKEALISQENKTSLEKEIFINVRKGSDRKEELILDQKMGDKLKKFDFADLSFEEEGSQIQKRKFGVVRFANTSSIFDSSTNSKKYELCVRTVEIPALNRFLLEDVERDMNKHIFLQNKLKNKMVNLIGFSIHDEAITFVYENMKNGSLGSLFANSRQDALSFEMRIKTLLDLAKVMSDLQGFSIIHGHLSPNNILFDSEFNLRIGDLLFYDLKKYTGYSKGYSNKTKYTAPEYLKDNGFISLNPNVAGDVYSFAIIAWEIVTGDIAFRDVGKSELRRLLIEENSRPKIPENISMELAKLIRVCWQSEPGNRPNFLQIINILQEFDKKM